MCTVRSSCTNGTQRTSRARRGHPFDVSRFIRSRRVCDGCVLSWRCMVEPSRLISRPSPPPTTMPLRSRLSVTPSRLLFQALAPILFMRRFLARPRIAHECPLGIPRQRHAMNQSLRFPHHCATAPAWTLGPSFSDGVCTVVSTPPGWFAVRL